MEQRYRVAHQFTLRDNRTDFPLSAKRAWSSGTEEHLFRSQRKTNSNLNPQRQALTPNSDTEHLVSTTKPKQTKQLFLPLSAPSSQGTAVQSLLNAKLFPRLVVYG